MTVGEPLSYERQLEQAKAFLQANDRFLVVSHVHPDGDAASSTLAVGYMLECLGKQYAMVNEGSVPAKFHMLWNCGRVLDYSKTPVEGSPEFDCVISVDCADYARMGEVRSWFSPEIPLLNIDHHPTNDAYGTVNVIKPDAAATAEVLYDLAVALGITWDVALAECIYTGLLTDTGGFRYSNTTPKVMRIASEMLQYGVNGNELADHLLERMTYSQVAMLRKALANLSFSANRQIAWISVTLEEIRESGATNEDLEGLVNYPRNIEGVEVGMLFKQTDTDKFKVSLRSAGRADVAAIAKSFGGGGHVRASGCSLEGSLKQVIQQMLKEVELALL